MNKLYDSIDLERLNKNKHITFLNKKKTLKVLVIREKQFSLIEMGFSLMT